MIGKKVKHAMLGIGTITEAHNDYIIVDFGTRTSKFVYPDAFEKYLVAEDDSLQKVAIQKIKEKKEAEEQIRFEKEAKEKEIAAQKQLKETMAPAKKKQDIDALFSDDYHVNYLARQPILNYKQVENDYGIRITGFGKGINPTESKIVLISTIKKANGAFVYHDKWTSDGDYIYSGEGKNGNQTLSGGNLAIRNAAEDGKEIHLFVKFSPQEYYYQGIFELIDYTYEDELGEDGKTRKEYKFRLRKV